MVAISGTQWTPEANPRRYPLRPCRASVVTMDTKVIGLCRGLIWPLWTHCQDKYDQDLSSVFGQLDTYADVEIGEHFGY